MAEYKDGRGNTSQDHGGMSFCGHDLCTRSRVFCCDQDNSQKSHCNRTNHTIDRCWELHGKPSWPPQVAYLSGTTESSIAHD